MSETDGSAPQSDTPDTLTPDRAAQPATGAAEAPKPEQAAAPAAKPAPAKKPAPAPRELPDLDGIARWVEGEDYPVISALFNQLVLAKFDRLHAQIKKAELTSCPTNLNVSGRILVPRVGGFWFNDGTCVSRPCVQPDGSEDFTGDMWATIEIRRDSPIFPAPAEANRVVTAVAQVLHCNLDADCDGGNTIAFVELAKFKVPKSGVRNGKLRIQWDAAGDQFIFQLNNDPVVMIPYPGALNVSEQGGGYFKRVELRANVQNCNLTGPNPPERPMARGDIRLKDVKVNDGALP